MEVPLCWGDFPEGSSRKGPWKEKREWMWEQFSGSSLSFFSVVELISCTSLRGSYENSLVGGCFLICYCITEGIIPPFPSVSTAGFDHLKNPVQIFLWSFMSLCSVASISFETVMATRGPWGGGGGEQNIALNVLLQILAPFFFFPPGKMKQNKTKLF